MAHPYIEELLEDIDLLKDGLMTKMEQLDELRAKVAATPMTLPIDTTPSSLISYGIVVDEPTVRDLEELNVAPYLRPQDFWIVGGGGRPVSAINLAATAAKQLKDLPCWLAIGLKRLDELLPMIRPDLFTGVLLDYEKSTVESVGLEWEWQTDKWIKQAIPLISKIREHGYRAGLVPSGSALQQNYPVQFGRVQQETTADPMIVMMQGLCLRGSLGENLVKLGKQLATYMVPRSEVGVVLAVSGDAFPGTEQVIECVKTTAIEGYGIIHLFGRDADVIAAILQDVREAN